MSRRLQCSVVAGWALICLANVAVAQSFAYEPPGQLQAANTAGVTDNTIWVPGMRFPIENAPAYPNSQVYGTGGLYGPPGGQCASVNFNYPWHDNYCEPRTWSMPLCPAGTGHQGQDIRAATCDDAAHWAVAAEAGQITSIGSYSVYLTTPSGVLHRYLHMKMTGLPVWLGQQVPKGQKMGLVSDTFFDSNGNAVPTSRHLHYDIRMYLAQTGVNTYVPPYTSLIDSYQELLVPPEPCAAIPAGGATIDELSTCFEKFGPPQFWRTESGIGVDGHIFWTNAFDGASPSNWAKWTLDVQVAGQYELEVHVVSPFNLSTATPYRIRHGGAETDVTLNQASSAGWRSLGTYQFGVGADQWVAVYDNSGETGQGLHITADAVRLTPISPPVVEPDPPPPVDEGPPPVEDTYVPPPEPDLGPPPEPDLGPPPEPDLGPPPAPDLGPPPTPDAGIDPVDSGSGGLDVIEPLDVVEVVDAGGGEDPPVQAEDCEPLGPQGGLIDDLDGCFMADGAFERNEGVGMGGAHVADGSGEQIPGTATWTLKGTVSGVFDIEAYIPEESTGVVSYVIGGERYAVDTDRMKGWRLLSSIELKPGVEQKVQLSTADIPAEQAVYADALWVRPSLPVAADCVVPGTGGVVDDAAPCFSAVSGFEPAAGYGYGGSVHLATGPTETAARYTFSIHKESSPADDELSEPYDLQVRAVTDLNLSERVEYRWAIGSGATFVGNEEGVVSFDSRDVDGWVALGKVLLPPGAQHVLLVSNQDSQPFAADAIRLIPADGIPNVSPPPPRERPRTDREDRGDNDVPTPSPVPSRTDGGCSATGHSQKPPGLEWLLVGFLGLCLAYRRQLPKG